MKHNGLIMLFMLIQMLAYNLNDNYFFLLTSLSLVIIPIYLILNHNKHRFVKLLLVLTIANVIDEVLGLALIRNVIEYLFGLTAFILILCQKKI